MNINFLKVHIHGDPVLINLLSIVYVEEDGNQTIITTTKDIVTVDEPYDVIERRVYTL